MLAPSATLYATGNVTGSFEVGGLVGCNFGTINNAYATGNVTGSDSVGGLVGACDGGVNAISNAYATGNVTGDNSVGGLVGDKWFSTISNAYATGTVTGYGFEPGGLVGHSDGTPVVNSYWNTQTTGQAVSGDGGTGLTTAQMKQQASFAGWDISATGGGASVWRIYEGQTGPLLRGLLAPLTVTASNTSKTYDGLTYSSSTAYTTSAAADANKIFGTVASSDLNVGTHAISAAGIYSNQQGYDLSYANGTLTVNPASLTVSANNDNKTYDGNAYSGGNGAGYAGFVNGETAAVLGGALAYGGNSQGAINAGSYAITPSGRTATNYTITFVNGILTITGAAPAPESAPSPAIETADASTPNGGVLWRNTQVRETEPAAPPPSAQPASPSVTPTIEVAQLHGLMENRLLSIPPNFIRLQEE